MERAARRSWKAALFLAFVAYQLLAHFAWRDSAGVNAVSGLTHAAAYLFLLWYFGRTLRPGQESLITRLASSVHGTLPPDIAVFTRRVTLSWCVFFAGQVLVSVLLLAFAPFGVWSTFVNVLNLPLLVLMFVGDHLYRALRFPSYPRASILRVLRAFAEVTSNSKGSKAL